MSHNHHGQQGGQREQGHKPGGHAGGGGNVPIRYGFAKCKVLSSRMKGSFNKETKETQYHLHATLHLGTSRNSETWDSAINVGTDDSDDLLRYKLVFDFHHPIVDTLSAADYGFNNLTDKVGLPSLDFLRTDILKETGPWRDTDVMDGSLNAAPVNKLKPLLDKAHSQDLDVYIFGREYNTNDGVHDVHMNQGSTGGFINTGSGDRGDHNRINEDGAVFVDLGEGKWAAYFAAFTKQMVPTDDLGNPAGNAHELGDDDDGSLISS
jgi:uncharacterized protein YukJ